GQGPPEPDAVREMLDMAAAFFERGGNVAGFVPTCEDLERVRRLRDLVTAANEEELAERHRLAKELWARLPPDYVSAGVLRMITSEQGLTEADASSAAWSGRRLESDDHE